MKSKMKLGSYGKLTMMFLIIINIFLFILGLSIMLGGMMMQADNTLVNDEIKPVLNTATVNSMKLGDLIANLSIIFIVIGVLVILVSGFGLFGACCENKCMLIMYAIFLIALIITKAVALILWFIMKLKIEDSVRHDFLNALKNKFTTDDINSQNKISNAWNLLFLRLHCCAINNVTGRDNDFDNTTWCTQLPGSCEAGNYEIPRTCCNNVTIMTYKSAKPSCFQNVATGTYNEKGCFDAIKDQIPIYGKAFFGLGLSIMGVELICLVSVICTIHCARKRKKNSV